MTQAPANSPLPEHHNSHLTVATFNICSGRATDGTITSQRLTDAIAAIDADVLAVQEVDRNQSRSAAADHIAVIRDAFGAVDARMQPTLRGQPGPGTGWQALPAPTQRQLDAEATHSGLDPATSNPNAPDPAAAEPLYGVGLVSRLPVIGWRVCHLGHSRAVLPFPIPRPGRRLPQLLFVPDEPRIALAAVISTPAGPVTVISTHLSFAPITAARQLRRLIRWAATLPGPRVLAGDLNLPGKLPSTLSRWRSLTQEPTYPTSRPRIQLDHLLTDAHWAKHQPHPSEQLAVSDHRLARATLSGLHR